MRKKNTVRPMRQRVFLVTESNQDWVAEHTNSSLADVLKCYDDAQKDGTVCWIEERPNA